MSASEKFLRFADECEVMASLARDPQSKLMWRTFAARWSAYAKSVESKFAKAHISLLCESRAKLAMTSHSSANRRNFSEALIGLSSRIFLLSAFCT